MNCDKPKIREIKVWKLTEKATKEIKSTFGDVEAIKLFKNDGDVVELAFPGNCIVETNHCDGSCSVYEVSSDACCCPGREFLDVEVEKVEISCSDPKVTERTKGKILKHLIPSSLAIYENSSCGCTYGVCLHK